MTKTIRDMLFYLIGCELRGETAELDRELSEEELAALYHLAKLHDLAHLIAEALNKAGEMPTGKIGAALQKQWVLSTYRYEQIHYEFLRICDALEKAKIPHIPLKGSVIREYYPEPWMRTSCDIDILVKEEDLEQAERVFMETLGYRWEAKGTHDVAFYSGGDVHIELHFDLIERLPSVRPVLEKVWTTSVVAEGFSYRRFMSDEMFYFYHIAHTAKHFLQGGCGVRPLMDLWILEHKIPHDEEKRAALLKKGKLHTFATEAEKLAEVWFGDGTAEPVTQDMENYILKAGVYGSMENRIATEDKPKGGKIGYFFSRVFLCYAALKIQYPVLEKHKWLYPVCQVRRWFRLLFKGMDKQSVRAFKITMSMTDEKKKRIAFLFDDLDL